jgi:hypothetical protein
VRVWSAIGMLAVMALAACGGSGSQPSETAATGATSQTGPAATTAAPEHPLPVELQGTWFLSTATATNPVRIYLRETSFATPIGRSGTVEAEGDVLTFTAVCGGTAFEGVGRYRWTLEGDTLHLDMIGKDECGGRRSILDDATYERTD